MANTNPVTQVLVTSGNQHPLAAGNRVTALKNGQIGVFNAHTGLSVDITKADELKEVFIAVGINRTSGGTATAEDINMSTGINLQARNAHAYTFKGYTPYQAKVVKISNFAAPAVGDEFTVKVEYRNQASYRINGYNQFAKPYSVVATATTQASVVTALIALINADPEGLVTASSADAGASLVLTSNPTPVGTTYKNDIDIKYLGLSGTDIIVSTPSGFTGATIATTQELAFASGLGRDIKHIEYIAGGWNGRPGPYRQSSVTGLARQDFEYFADTAVNYNVVSLNYDFEAVGGKETYLNNLCTVLAIPCADTLTLIGDGGTTSKGIIGILDAVLSQFNALTDDATTNGDCTNVATNLLTPATDGVESLS